MALPVEPTGGPRWRAAATPTSAASATVIADGIAAGMFAPVDPAVAAAFVLTALNGMVAWYRPDGRLGRGPRRCLRRPVPARRLAKAQPEAVPHDRPARARPDPRAAPSATRARHRRTICPHDEWFARFEAHVAAGGTVEATDPMPDEYRTAVLRFVEMHANSELMGVLPEREWLMRAPTLRRKLALTAKVQDEVGHAQLLYRVAEDLGKPREAMFDDLLAGKTKFHNVFHYPTRSWADVGMIAWLVDAAAIVAQHGVARLAMRRTRGRCARSAGRNRSTSCTAATSW